MILALLVAAAVLVIVLILMSTTHPTDIPTIVAMRLLGIIIVALILAATAIQITETLA